MLTDERIRKIWAQATGEREPLVYIVGQAMDAFARAVEREARREALEEAAWKLEQQPQSWNGDSAAAVIRALIEKEPT